MNLEEKPWNYSGKKVQPIPPSKVFTIKLGYPLLYFLNIIYTNAYILIDIDYKNKRQ
jgi:hypothetical protein